MTDEQPLVLKNLNTVPEVILKKRKKNEEWALSRKQAFELRQKTNEKIKKETPKKIHRFIIEYRQRERDLVRYKRVAKSQGKKYSVDPEARLLFVIRMQVPSALHPKTKKIFRHLRLFKMHDGVFLQVNKSTLEMLKKVEPYVAYGYPNLKSVKELIYKRGHGKVNRQRVALTDNLIIEENLGKYGILCIEDLVHEIATLGPHFKETNSFLWPFKLGAPSGDLEKKGNRYVEIAKYGNHEDDINKLIARMN